MAVTVEFLGVPGLAPRLDSGSVVRMPPIPHRPSEIGLAFLQHPISMPPVGESWRRSAMAMLMTTAMAVPLRSLPKLDVDLRGEVSVKKIAPQVHCHPREIGFTCLAPLLPHRPSGGRGRPRRAFRETRASLHWKTNACCVISRSGLRTFRST